MSATLFIFFCFVGLALLSAAAFRRKLFLGVKANPTQLKAVPLRPVSLFDPDEASPKQLDASDAARGAARRREDLLRRAAGGDLTALRDAKGDWREAGQNDLFDEVIGVLLENAIDTESVQALTTYVRQGRELRAPARLVELYRQTVWQENPTQNTMSELLHLAALSDDADVFANALTAIVTARRTGLLPNVSVQNVCELVEAHFWTISPAARNTGAGFWLKRRLANLRPSLSKQ